MAQQKNVDYNNPSSYKNCSKKFYDIYVCMPPKNTIVVNKLEQADVVKQLGGRTYFTVDDIKKLQSNNPTMIQTLQQLVGQGRAYAVTDATPFVLCGTVGEMWTIKPDKLSSTYTFLQDGQPLQINQQTLDQRMKNGLLDWTIIRVSRQATQGQNMACFVPSSQKGQIQTSWGAVLNINGVGVSHGKGDFVVCSKLPNGKPNLADRWVVNGEIFATTYNNQGWADCLNQSGIKNITIDSLPKLVSVNNSQDYLNVDEFLERIKLSRVQGSIGISHVLEEVYNNLSTDTVSERVKLCHNIYNNLDIGYGSASLAFAKRSEQANRGSILGTSILSHKMNLSTLIKSLVSACMQEETKSNALSILYYLSENALSEAILELFYNTDNPNLSVLWKRLDLQYMFNDKIVLYTYNQSEYDINSKRVCIDFRLGGFSGIFVRCVYTSAGNYGFDFIPKTPIADYGVGFTFSFDKDYDNYLYICKQLSDSCYKCFTDFTNSSKPFINNLPKYLISTDYEYLGLLGGKVAYFFKIISSNSDAHKSDYNKETNTYRIKFAVGNETRVIYMREDDSHTVSVKCTLNGVTFEKSYKLSIKHNISINAMLIFSDICKALKIHPAKELLKSKRLWDNVTQTVSEKFSTGNHRKFDSVDVSSRIDKIIPVSINLLDSKYEILMRLYNNEKVIGERVLVADFNYKNFDIKTTNSRSIKALGDLRSSRDITDMLFSMHYKYSSDETRVVDYPSSIDITDIIYRFYWATYNLINSTKKYQS